ncbi:LytR/AlgR family response regulator transcription factor [Paenibacillus graminis]|uniref:LytR/AlgR family response regulator transcription factor n=1 Tax=Paenibacillus graminis TaxID=189425 RepID=UPI002DC04904|nr:LytTR family DNA-binding domain-containing protein [Paenibacillus graminis]MEC0170018.1 LytTR family DNA-binding domain-containing protein [Paenibacillus graminis]
MLNVAFCDDDIRFLNSIVSEAKKIFKRLKVNTTIYTYTNGKKLIDDFEEYHSYYDIIFLDIDLPEMDGKEVARNLRLFDKKFKLVFVTSFEQEVLNTFQYDVSGFLPKRLINERLFLIIDRVVTAIKDDNPQLQVFKVNITGDKRAVIKVPLNDIMFFGSVNRKNYIHTKRRIYLLHGYKFMDLIAQYSELGFVDIHRTCIVNIQYIFSVDDIEIRLDDGTLLPLSRRKRSLVLNKFLQKVCEGKNFRM